jgi:hypothetical protein
VLMERRSPKSSEPRPPRASKAPTKEWSAVPGATNLEELNLELRALSASFSPVWLTASLAEGRDAGLALHDLCG